jgi:hypothetical protein
LCRCIAAWQTQIAQEAIGGVAPPAAKGAKKSAKGGGRASKRARGAGRDSDASDGDGDSDHSDGGDDDGESVVRARYVPSLSRQGGAIQVFDNFFIHECLIRPKYFFQKFNPSPICMGFTLKLPQKLSLDFTFKA